MSLKIIEDFIKWIKLASKTINNVFPTLLFRLGLKNKVTIKTKTIGNFKLKNNNLKIKIIKQIMDFQLYAMKNNLTPEKLNSFKNLIEKLCEDSDTLTVNEITYLKNNMIFVLFEPFYENGNIITTNVKNKLVIDIGANIGDTALTFAKQGCEVYAYEPIPDIYEIAIKNIELNPTLKDKIHLFNCAISDKNEEIEIYYNGLGSSKYNKSDKQYKIQALSLNEVTQDLIDKKLNPTLLKIDCEGSEFDIIPNSNLTMFNEIFLEYHSIYTGLDKNILIHSLKQQNFNINAIYKAPGIDIPLDDIGIIHATKEK